VIVIAVLATELGEVDDPPPPHAIAVTRPSPAPATQRRTRISMFLCY
jgi:hypothetical protein